MNNPAVVHKYQGRRKDLALRRLQLVVGAGATILHSPSFALPWSGFTDTQALRRTGVFLYRCVPLVRGRTRPEREREVWSKLLTATRGVQQRRRHYPPRPRRAVDAGALATATTADLYGVWGEGQIVYFQACRSPSDSRPLTVKASRTMVATTLVVLRQKVAPDSGVRNSAKQRNGGDGESELLRVEDVRGATG